MKDSMLDYLMDWFLRALTLTITESNVLQGYQL